MDFWAGVHSVWDGHGRLCWRLADGRVITQAEMEQRERLFKAGRDPDAPWSAGIDDVDTVLGPVVATERARRQLTQRGLAQVAGVSQSMVARLERGVREPSWRTFRLLLDAMQLEPVVDVRETPGRQTTAPSSVSSSGGGPCRML